MSTTNLFEGGAAIDPNKDYTTDLVGEGKPYSDNKALARAVVEKELFIKTLLKEKDELRDDLSRRQAVKDAIAELQKTNAQTPAHEVNPEGQAATEVALNEDKIKQLIRDTLTSASKETTEQNNLAFVQQQLTEVWGSEFPSKLKEAAKQIGASESFLTEVARSQPKAFLKLVGAEKPEKAEAPGLFQASAAGVNTAALNAGNRGKLPEQETYSYWKKVRKENETYYHSAEAAKLRHAAAIKHGEAFYAT